MEPKNVLDQNTRTVISAIKKNNYENTELKKILDSENENRKRNKLIVFLEKIILKKKNEKIIKEILPEENKVEEKISIKEKIIPVKELIISKKGLEISENRKNIPDNLTFVREDNEYNEYIDEKTGKKYSFVVRKRK